MIMFLQLMKSGAMQMQVVKAYPNSTKLEILEILSKNLKDQILKEIQIWFKFYS